MKVKLTKGTVSAELVKKNFYSAWVRLADNNIIKRKAEQIIDFWLIY